jgi:hypothetical protein
MTDARLPERWLNDRRLQRLTPEHYRSYVNALLWSVANRTDGRIEQEDLGLIPHWSANAAKAFVDAGLFTPQSRGWLIADYAATQTSRDELATLDELRAREREKKARQRAKKKESPGGGGRVMPLRRPTRKLLVKTTVPGTVPGTCPRGQHRTRTRTGQAGRPGQGGDQPTNEHANPDATNGHSPDVDWPPWRGQGPDPFEEYA